MPTSVPMPTKIAGDVFALAMWNNNLRDNLNKLLSTGHRVLTVAQFGALVSPEGTKGTVAPDEVYIEVDATNGIQWHLAYESGETTYKWRFLGGPAMFSEVVAAEATASTTYVDLTTVGPSITLPRGGDYDYDYGHTCTGTVVASGVYVAFKRGAAATAEADRISLIIDTTAGLAPVSRKRRATGAAASDVIKLQQRVTTGTGTFQDRWLSITPVRIV